MEKNKSLIDREIEYYLSEFENSCQVSYLPMPTDRMYEEVSALYKIPVKDIKQIYSSLNDRVLYVLGLRSSFLQ